MRDTRRSLAVLGGVVGALVLASAACGGSAKGASGATPASAGAEPDGDTSASSAATSGADTKALGAPSDASAVQAEDRAAATSEHKSAQRNAADLEADAEAHEAASKEDLPEAPAELNLNAEVIRHRDGTCWYTYRRKGCRTVNGEKRCVSVPPPRQVRCP